MSHSWESEFRRDVASWLIDNGFHVRSNVYLPESQRWVDLIAEGPFGVYAVETESRFSSAFKGVSQAAVYAEGVESQYPNKPVTAVVIVPSGHVQEPERTDITHRTGIPIVEGWFV